MKEQIKQALENAHKLPWRLDSFGAVVNSNNELVQWFEDGHVTAEKEDAHLISNAPEWLRWQNERIDQLEKSLQEAKIECMYDRTLTAMVIIDQALGKEE